MASEPTPPQVSSPAEGPTELEPGAENQDGLLSFDRSHPLERLRESVEEIQVGHSQIERQVIERNGEGVLICRERQE